MRSLSELLHRGEKWTTDNSPAILTGIGVAGVVTTAYLASKATVRATRLIDDLEREVREGQRANLIPDVSKREKFELIWKLYIPAAGVGSFTIAAIIFANRIGNRRAAAMASAMALSERAFDEYRTKVVETIGKNKEQKVRDEIAQDQVDRTAVQHVIKTQGGDSLFMDAYSGRYFWSDMQTVKAAENEINHDMLTQGYASLSDFYNKLGLPNTAESDNVGWNSDKLLEIHFSTTISDDNQPCMVINFTLAPIRDFFRSH